VAALPATGAAAVVSAWTCVISRFEVPAFDSLGEALLLDADSGAVAVFAPTGLSTSGQAHVLNRFYFEALQNHRRIGDAVIEMFTRFAAAGGDLPLRRTYTLLGDPALVIGEKSR